MSIRKLLFETAFILLIITLSVITINSFQVHTNASRHFAKLQEEYFDTTYQIYKDEIIGNLLLGDKDIENALFNEIANRRKIGISISYQNTHIVAGNYTAEVPVKTYEIKLGERKKAILSLYPMNDQKKPWILDELIMPLVLEAFMLSLGFVYLWRRFNQSLLSPLSDLVANLKPGQIETYTPNQNTIYELKELSDTLKLMNIEIQDKIAYEAEVNTAKQVGHDIRSPLACLILSLSQTSELPEDLRTLMRSAIQRITDIANSLHTKALRNKNSDAASEAVESTMISSLVDSLISEKRMQLRDKENVQIDLNFENAYGLFSKINSTDLKRVLSNLINNSVESFDSEVHHIHVAVERDHNWVQILIQDDGKGIPSDILDKLGLHGFSYGKENFINSGTGLGISHAVKVIKSFEGVFSITSELGVGTKVTISLPKSDIPNWFVEKLSIDQAQQIIVLDDDQSIYNLWRDRFSRLPQKNIKLIHYSSVISSCLNV